MSAIVPSLPAASFSEIETLAEVLKGTVSELQIDMVDGEFVPAVSWPFTEVVPGAAMEALRPLTHDFAIEVDCMLVQPEQYLDLFVALGVVRVIIHMHSTEQYEAIVTHAKAHDYRLGLGFTNDVPLSELQPHIPNVDFVQVMGIAEVGMQGQPFDERTLNTVQTLRALYPELEIAVDGSVNADTIVSLREAGANRFAPGSAIAKQPDPVAAYHQLKDLVL